MKYLLGIIAVPAGMLTVLWLNDNGYDWLAFGLGLIIIGSLGIYLSLQEIANRKPKR